MSTRLPAPIWGKLGDQETTSKGTAIENVEPLPGSVRTSTEPPMISVRRLTMDSPRPLPP